MGVRWFLVGSSAVLWFAPIFWWDTCYGVGDFPCAVIRFSGLLGLPATTWFILKLIWQRWKPGAEAEAKVAKVNAALVAIVCFIIVGVALLEGFSEVGFRAFLPCYSGSATRCGELGPIMLIFTIVGAIAVYFSIHGWRE